MLRAPDFAFLKQKNAGQLNLRKISKTGAFWP